MTRNSKADIAARLGRTAKTARRRGDHKQGNTDGLRARGSEARGAGLAARLSVAGVSARVTQSIRRLGLPIAETISNAPRTPRTVRVATDLSRCAKATVCFVARGSFPDPDPTRPRGSRKPSSKTPPKSRLTGLTALIVEVDEAEAAR
jgi:hypothetical protein